MNDTPLQTLAAMPGESKRSDRAVANADHKSAIVKRSVELHGHKTSVSLEDEFWNGLHDIAAATHTALPALLRVIDAKRGTANLSSAIRVFVLQHYRDAATVKTPD